MSQNKRVSFTYFAKLPIFGIPENMGVGEGRETKTPALRDCLYLAGAGIFSLAAFLRSKVRFTERVPMGRVR